MTTHCVNSCAGGKFSHSQGQTRQVHLGNDADGEASKNQGTTPEDNGSVPVQSGTTHETKAVIPTSPTPSPNLVNCTINPNIQFQALTQFVPQGTMTATGTRTLNLPADATEIKISLMGYSVDDHSIGLTVNGISVLNMTEASNTKSYSRILSTPIAITALKPGANAITGSAGENPSYNRGRGHIGAGFCFQGTYRASVCKSEIGMENPAPSSPGCQP